MQEKAWQSWNRFLEIKSNCIPQRSGCTYATVIFAGNVVYYLGRLICYKIGCISHPVHQHARFNHKRKKRRRFYKTKSIKRWKYKRRWASRPAPSHFTPPCFDQEPQSTVLTTVLNIDNRTNKRNVVSFDLDASTVVCDNLANVHICNDKNVLLAICLRFAATK